MMGEPDVLFCYLRTQLDHDMLHELCTQWDDGRLEDTMEKLLEIDAARFPEEYITETKEK